MNLENFKKDYYHEANRYSVVTAQLLLDELTATTQLEKELVSKAHEYLVAAGAFNKVLCAAGMDVFR
jgi:hypothetical protein